MKAVRLLFCAAIALLAACTLNAQQAVTFPSGNGTAQGFLFTPTTPGPHPAPRRNS